MAASSSNTISMGEIVHTVAAHDAAACAVPQPNDVPAILHRLAAAVMELGRLYALLAPIEQANRSRKSGALSPLGSAAVSLDGRPKSHFRKPSATSLASLGGSGIYGPNKGTAGRSAAAREAAALAAAAAAASSNTNAGAGGGAPAAGGSSTTAAAFQLGSSGNSTSNPALSVEPPSPPIAGGIGSNTQNAGAPPPPATTTGGGMGSASAWAISAISLHGALHSPPPAVTAAAAAASVTPMCLSPPARRLVAKRVADVLIEISRMCVALNIDIHSNVHSVEDPLGLLWLTLPHCRSPVDNLLAPGEVISRTTVSPRLSRRGSPRNSPAGSPRARSMAFFAPQVLTPNASNNALMTFDDAGNPIGTMLSGSVNGLGGSGVHPHHHHGGYYGGVGVPVSDDEDELGAVAVMSIHSGFDQYLPHA